MQRASSQRLTVWALALLSTVVVVPETEQAVVIRLGEPNRVINRFRPNVEFGQTGAGLTWRIPFFENLVRIDRRILSVDPATLPPEHGVGPDGKYPLWMKWQNSMALIGEI